MNGAYRRQLSFTDDYTAAGEQKATRSASTYHAGRLGNCDVGGIEADLSLLARDGAELSIKLGATSMHGAVRRDGDTSTSSPAGAIRPGLQRPDGACRRSGSGGRAPDRADAGQGGRRAGVRGPKVKKGEPLLIMEAMKMEHTIAAPSDGVVEEMLYPVGDQVAEARSCSLSPRSKKEREGDGHANSSLPRRRQDRSVGARLRRRAAARRSGGVAGRHAGSAVRLRGAVGAARRAARPAGPREGDLPGRRRRRRDPQVRRRAARRADHPPRRRRHGRADGRIRGARGAALLPPFRRLRKAGAPRHLGAAAAARQARVHHRRDGHGHAGQPRAGDDGAISAFRCAAGAARKSRSTASSASPASTASANSWPAPGCWCACCR